MTETILPLLAGIVACKRVERDAVKYFEGLMVQRRVTAESGNSTEVECYICIQDKLLTMFDESIGGRRTKRGVDCITEMVEIEGTVCIAYDAQRHENTSVLLHRQLAY